MSPYQRRICVGQWAIVGILNAYKRFSKWIDGAKECE